MTASNPTSGRASALLLAAGAILGAVVFTLVFLKDGNLGTDAVEQPEVALPTPSVLQQGGAADPARIVELVSVAPDERSDELQYGPSTVLWPLEIHLDLVRPALLPDVPSGPPLGTGATAQLRGRITDLDGAGAQATISLLGGPNDGRELTTGADGVFGAIDLYPGLEVVEVRGPRILGSKREVRLQQDKETLLNIVYAQPGGAQGRVLDQRNEAVAGATITIDGQSTLTDAKGNFLIPHIAAGRSVLVEIDHPDYSPFRGETGIARSFVAEPSRLVFNMQDPATVVFELANDVGGPGPAQVVLVPTHGGLNRTYPWYRVNPIELGSEPVTVTGLPPGTFYAYVFRPGAVGNPDRTRVTIAAGETRQVSLGLEVAPTLRGRVVRDGQVISGATVRLVAADPVRATLDVFREERGFLETEVLPALPAVRQTTTTDSNGEFLLTRGADVSTYRLLEAVSPDGRTRAVRAVGPDDEQVELELVPVEEGEASLQLLLSGRFQPLPVQVILDGRPREVFELPPDRDFELGGLAAGKWNLRVVWWAEELLSVDGLELDGVVQRNLALPEDARVGQDRETWTRAGRRWPMD
ncbi:carboxypeptidase-like regulatory domain-containing protein [Engelhardtia mirabilis]